MDSILQSSPEGCPDEPSLATRSRLVLVGCGRRVASAIAPTLKAMGAQIVGIADPDHDAGIRVADWMDQDSITVSNSVLTRQLLRETSPDAVIIASPSGLHFSHAEMALSVGFPTFVEKPLACSAADGLALQRVGAYNLATSEQRPHRRDLKYVREIIETGRLGQINCVRYHDSIAPAPHFAATWRNNPALAGGGAMFDIGYHTVGAVQWLLNASAADFEIIDVHLRYGNLQVEEHARVTCASGNIRIQFEVGISAYRPRESLSIQGSSAEVRLVRDRKTPDASIISFGAASELNSARSFSLNGQYDTRTLSDFICGVSNAADMGRQIDTLKFLEVVYRKAGIHRIPRCS